MKYYCQNKNDLIATNFIQLKIKEDHDAEIADLKSKDTSVDDSIANIEIKITDIESNDNTTNTIIADLSGDMVSSTNQSPKMIWQF